MNIDFLGRAFVNRSNQTTGGVEKSKFCAPAGHFGASPDHEIKKRARFFQIFLFLGLPTPQKNQAPGLKKYVLLAEQTQTLKFKP